LAFCGFVALAVLGSWVCVLGIVGWLFGVQQKFSRVCGRGLSGGGAVLLGG